jgi:hypothetical protein
MTERRRAMSNVVYYMQTDPKWKNVPYTVDGDAHETIGYSGCGPTCAAMVLATWVDRNITPIQTCELAIRGGHRTPNNGTAWSFFPWIAARYGLGHQQTSSTQVAADAIKKGALVVCSMGPGYFTKGGHFILAYDYKDGYFIVHDPQNSSKTKGSHSLFVNECRQYFIFTRQKEEVVIEMKKWAVATTKVNIRELPSENSTVIGSLNQGDRILILGKVYNKNWYMVSLGGDNVAYIASAYLKPEIDSMDSIGVLKAFGIIGDESYWRERRGTPECYRKDFVEIIIDRMASVLKSL